MTKQEAERIVAKARDGYDGPYIGAIEAGDKTVVVDGRCTAEQLEALAILLRCADDPLPL